LTFSLLAGEEVAISGYAASAGGFFECPVDASDQRWMTAIRRMHSNTKDLDGCTAKCRRSKKRRGEA
jgi:hypothetical protein